MGCCAQGLAQNQSLTRLDLEKKSFTASGALYLGAALRSASSLSHLIISRNTIGDAGLLSLGPAVGSLQVLELQDCGISGAGLHDFCASTDVAYQVWQSLDASIMGCVWVGLRR